MDPLSQRFHGYPLREIILSTETVRRVRASPNDVAAPEDVLDLDLSSEDMEREKLRHLPDLRSYVNLVHLDVSGNALATLEGVGRLPALETLDAARNQLRTLDDPLPVSLRRLHIEGNSILRLPRAVFRAMRQLEELNASGNSLRRFADIAALSDCDRLVELDLRGNPVADVAHYESFAIRSNERLLHLDGAAVTEDRRRDAAAGPGASKDGAERAGRPTGPSEALRERERRIEELTEELSARDSVVAALQRSIAARGGAAEAAERTAQRSPPDGAAAAAPSRLRDLRGGEPRLVEPLSPLQSPRRAPLEGTIAPPYEAVAAAAAAAPAATALRACRALLEARWRRLGDALSECKASHGGAAAAAALESAGGGAALAASRDLQGAIRARREALRAREALLERQRRHVASLEREAQSVRDLLRERGADGEASEGDAAALVERLGAAEEELKDARRHCDGVACDALQLSGQLSCGVLLDERKEARLTPAALAPPAAPPQAPPERVGAALRALLLARRRERALRGAAPAPGPLFGRAEPPEAPAGRLSSALASPGAGATGAGHTGAAAAPGAVGRALSRLAGGGGGGAAPAAAPPSPGAPGLEAVLREQQRELRELRKTQELLSAQLSMLKDESPRPPPAPSAAEAADGASETHSPTAAAPSEDGASACASPAAAASPGGASPAAAPQKDPRAALSALRRLEAPAAGDPALRLSVLVERARSLPAVRRASNTANAYVRAELLDGAGAALCSARTETRRDTAFPQWRQRLLLPPEGAPPLALSALARCRVRFAVLEDLGIGESDDHVSAVAAEGAVALARAGALWLRLEEPDGVPASRRRRIAPDSAIKVKVKAAGRSVAALAREAKAFEARQGAAALRPRPERLSLQLAAAAAATPPPPSSRRRKSGGAPPGRRPASGRKMPWESAGKEVEGQMLPGTARRAPREEARSAPAAGGGGAAATRGGSFFGDAQSPQSPRAPQVEPSSAPKRSIFRSPAARYRRR